MLSPTRTRAMLLASGAAIAGLLVGGLSTGVSHAADNESCRPDGLYKTAGVDVPYCSVYDTEGREKMGADHPRRIIGYFTSWRTGKNGAAGLPGQQHPVDQGHPPQLRVRPRRRRQQDLGRHADGANNAATGMTWPGVAGRRDGPGVPVQGPLQPAEQVQEAAPERQDADLASAAGRRPAATSTTTATAVDSGGFYRWPPTPTARSTRPASTPSPTRSVDVPRARTASTASTSTTSTRRRTTTPATRWTSAAGQRPPRRADRRATRR